MPLLRPLHKPGRLVCPDVFVDVNDLATWTNTTGFHRDCEGEFRSSRAVLLRAFLSLTRGKLPGIKINSPEVRCRGQKFHAHACAAVSGFAEVHNPAFLFFLRFRIHEHQDSAIVHFVSKHQQAAVGAHYLRLAHLAELASVVAAPKRLQPHPVKHPLAAPVPGLDYFGHAPIMRATGGPVNCPAGRVFPKCQATRFPAYSWPLHGPWLCRMLSAIRAPKRSTAPGSLIFISSGNLCSLLPRLRMKSAAPDSRSALWLLRCRFFLGNFSFYTAKRIIVSEGIT